MIHSVERGTTPPIKVLLTINNLLNMEWDTGAITCVCQKRSLRNYSQGLK